MSDSFTETTSTGWFGRIGQSFKGIVTGIILFVVAFPLLFWNEGRAVKRYTDLKEGSAAVVDADPASVDPSLEGELVHLTGEAQSDEQLSDPQFGIAAVGIQLKRTAEMYQWKERKETKTEKQIGGSEKKVTTYSYDRVWSDRLIDSSDFHSRGRDSHQNPASMPVRSQTQQAKLVTVGAYKLSPELIEQVDHFEPVTPNEGATANVKRAFDRDVQLSGDTFYFGATPGSPQIGDVRVTFAVARPTTVSFIGQQTGDSFSAWTTSRGRTVEQRLEVGSISADELFAQMQAENALLTWVLRGVGWLLMFVGITLVLRPLSVIADVLPILGNIVGFGAAVVAFLLASSLSLIVIAVAWVAYRPLIGVPLLLLGLGAAAALWFRKSGGQLTGTRSDETPRPA